MAPQPISNSMVPKPNLNLVAPKSNAQTTVPTFHSYMMVLKLESHSMVSQFDLNWALPKPNTNYMMSKPSSSSMVQFSCPTGTHKTTVVSPMSTLHSHARGNSTQHSAWHNTWINGMIILCHCPQHELFSVWSRRARVADDETSATLHNMSVNIRDARAKIKLTCSAARADTPYTASHSSKPRSTSAFGLCTGRSG